MIIKKWSGSAWEAQPIETTAQSIKTAMGAGSVFDSNNKLYPAYLPDMALAGMRFISVLTAAQTDTVAEVADLIHTQVVANYLQTPTASTKVMHGLYWIASAAAGTTFTIAPVIDFQHVASGKYYCIVGVGVGEENTNIELKVESGDWIIIQDFSGSGNQLDPYIVTLGVINNTYGVMSSSAYGIAKTGYTTDGGARNYKVDISSGNLFVNVPWTDNNTTYTAGTGLTLTGTEFAANLIDSTLRSVTAEAITTTASRTYAVMPDADGDLVVNVPWVDNNTTYTAGNGISLSGTQFSVAAGTGLAQEASGLALSHLGIQSLTDPNADRIFMWDDSAGSAAWLTVAGSLSISGTTLTGVNTTYSAGNGISLSGTQFSVAGGEGLTQETTGLKMTYPVYWADDLSGISPTTANSIGFEW